MKKNPFSNPRTADPKALGKLALATGSLSALSVLSFGVQAGIIYHDTSIGPISPLLPINNTTWDVDGKGGAEFRLKGAGNTIQETARAMLTSGNLNGRGLIQKGTTTSKGGYNFSGYVFQNLHKNFVIGPTLAKGYGFGSSGQTDRKLASSGYGVRRIANDAVGFPNNNGDNDYFGFKFTDGVDLFYGWAELNIDASNLAYTINRWAYNDTPEGSIRVGQTVPEPDTLSLTLLGLGAGGVRAWRKRKLALAA
ncbi:MAG: PEP-CTERM sorting domain-containing protein [Proteobacteria bacterium]|nr:PEP-CTERM sorting domain-containing protein [Pseudomonadota bacterium]